MSTGYVHIRRTYQELLLIRYAQIIQQDVICVRSQTRNVFSLLGLQIKCTGEYIFIAQNVPYMWSRLQSENWTATPNNISLVPNETKSQLRGESDATLVTLNAVHENKLRFVIMLTKHNIKMDLQEVG
jgi:hypothetical protein